MISTVPTPSASRRARLWPAIALVVTTVASPLANAQINGLEIAQSIPSHAAYDWETFSIDRTRYLALANFLDGSTVNANSTIYRWSGAGAYPVQQLSTQGAEDWESFTIDGTPYLAVSNYRTDSTYNVDSRIYQWNGTEFIDFQSIPTSGARDGESFTIDGITYLVVANHTNGTTNELASKLYRWDSGSFVETQSLNTRGATEWTHFTIDGVHYLAVANQKVSTDYTVNSTVFRWDGSQFVEYQEIATQGAVSVSSFEIGAEHFLVFANNYSGADYDVDSVIYRWSGTSFVEHQSIPTIGAYSWEHFQWRGEDYLIVANYRNTSTHNVVSRLYRWNNGQFSNPLDIPTSGIVDWAFFVSDGAPYLAAANYFDDTSYNIDSTIYRLNETLPPVAEIAIDEQSGIAPLTVSVDASASSDPDGGTITGYQWLTSDAQSATGATASFTFTQPGSYSIQLTVTDDEGQTASTTVDIQVNAVDTSNCEGRASYSAITGELQLPLMEVATVPLLGGVGRPAGETTVPAAATLRIIPGTTLFEIQSVLSATPDNDPAVTPCHARYTIDGVLDVPRVDVPVVTAIGGLTITTGIDTYHATLEQVPMSDLFQLTGIERLP